MESIKNQTYSNVEIIGVDNYSNDKTREIGQGYGARIYLKGPERASQVNFGMKNAGGKYVYRVDSDFVLEPSVVEEAVDKCEQEDFDAVCVHNTSDPSVSFWAKVRRLERDSYLGDEVNVAARFLRREVFEKVEGFNESLVAAEDYDFHNRLLRGGFRVGHIKSKEVHIGEAKSLLEIVRKHYYYGKTVKGFLDANPVRGVKQISPLRSAFFRNRRNLAKQPLLIVGFIVYQIARYSAAGFGFLSSLSWLR